MSNRVTVCYHIKSEAAAIEKRAAGVAVEQSIEMPLEAVSDPYVRSEIVGQVESIRPHGPGTFEVRIALALSTTGPEPGQLLNMLFGNSSIQDDVTLVDAELPASLAAHFGGPNQGIVGLRGRVGAERRALTCSALKPQGLPPAVLARLAGELARGRLDYIKDDHGLADQAYSPFAERVRLCADAVAAAVATTGLPTRYLPSLSGHLDQLRAQLLIVRECGLDSVLIAPMIVGLPSFHALVRENPDIAFMTHPAMAGAARIAPPLLLGKLFRLFGADATVFPNHGGRFGYSPATCRALADAALDQQAGTRACVPVPAGGMTLERVPELLDFYGSDVMLLIGGSLLSAGERVAAEAAAFVDQVWNFEYKTVR